MNSACALGLVILLAAPPSDEAFRAGVRPTEPLSPDEQQRTFHLPDGFEIQLFASEPDIQKPMNLAFDARGRLWMTGSVEYPYAAEGAGRDAIKVLEDTDGDGRADKITTFAEGLNIPIGLYPYRDGVVAYSIPNIWFFRDRDGDGRADQKEILYGPLGTPRDTHGMQNAFRRGFDGWLYINHGFANDTTIEGRDGSSIRLQSGNTYRVRLDGLRVEQITWGQVNPFGSVLLPDGDFITADCHSKPLTLLMRGGYYSSFGKPHDGLGFVPDLMAHDHGSTAICGVAQLTGRALPAALRGQLVVGNVMTSRVNRDSLHYTGSSPRAVEEADFLRTDDPWFRPVDLQLGPDGALYIADFYNRIIGHYEVPLEHPGRDKHRARIWRVVYREQESHDELASADLANATVDELIEALASDHLSRRMLATDQLSDRIGEPAEEKLREALQASGSETLRVHSLWALQRLGKLTAAEVIAAARDESELVRVHAQRVLAETPDWSSELVGAAKRGLGDPSPLVQRAAAGAVGRQGKSLVLESIAAMQRAPAEDAFLRHAWKISVREQLARLESWSTLRDAEFASETRESLAEICLGITSADAAEFLFETLQSSSRQSDQLERQIAHLVLHLPESRMDEVIPWIRRELAVDLDSQAKLLVVSAQRFAQRGVRDRSALQSWGLDLARQLLDSAGDSPTEWRNQTGDNPWGLEPRRCDDGQTATFLSSLPGGERKTSVLRSPEFVLPPRLSFYLCGHLGFPGKPAVERNQVVLRLANSGEVVVRALPPRHDTARKIDWDLAGHAGQKGYLELVDQIDLDAYAWLAVARFEPPVVAVPAVSPAQLVERQVTAATLAVALQLEPLRERLLRLAIDQDADWVARQAAARACLAGRTRPLLEAACQLLSAAGIEAELKNELTAALQRDPTDDVNLLRRTMQAASSREQRQVADVLATTRAGAEALLVLMEKGQATSRLLQDPAIAQKLRAGGYAGFEERMATLLSALPAANVELQKLMDARRQQFREEEADRTRGLAIFQKHCAACHQVGGQGALVGPQLDGIGNRGVERVIEDVLDPNRNVDATFHVSVLTLVDGRVVTGLVRREEGENVILADQQGKEFSVLRKDIDERVPTRASLMPANVNELLKPDEFRDLLGFLLSLRAKAEGGGP